MENKQLCNCEESRSTYNLNDQVILCSWCDLQTPEQEKGSDHVDHTSTKG